jgi:predicted DNA-binding transcriptional regulator YafY
MRDQLHAPISYDAFNKGYYYAKKTYRLPAGFTGAEDMQALGMAKSILTLYRETPLFEASSRLLENIIAPSVSDGGEDWLDNRIVVPKIASARVETDVWEIVVAGLKGNRVLTFDYRGIGNKESQNRRVRPYQLLFDSGVWYLYGFAEERKGTRIFSLSRMKNAALTKDGFSLPKKFSYSDSAGDSYFGVFIGQEKHRFIIDCFGEAAIYAAERQWAADQKVTGIEDGVTIKFTSTQDYKVLKWVLSNGCNAVPRKPKKLVDEWKRNISEMRKMAARREKERSK